MFHMNGRCGYKGMNTASIGAFKGLCSTFNITANRSRQAANTALSDGVGNGLNCFKVSLTGDSEARFNNIDTHLLKGFGNTHFFIFGHGCAGALLAIAQGGIKND